MRTAPLWVVPLLCPLLGCVCGRTDERTYSPTPELTLRYVVAFPEGDAPAPLWVFQPGDGTLSEAFDANAAAVLASSVALRERVVFVFPELRRQHLSGDSQRYCELDFFHRIDDLQALTDEAKLLPQVDPARLFFVAHSAGSEIVTLTAARRSDVTGVATYGGGAASLGELDLLPPAFERMRNNDCSTPARHKLRQGLFWQQLFVDAQLFQAIQQVDRPYLALLGDRDETVPWAENEPWGRQLEALEPTFRLEALRGGTHSLSSEPWGRMSAFFASQ
jgi:pimeloyl-ACP methyl ester carboxylesterase